MYIKELRRYPVKSMAGERLTQVQMGELGLEGDRIGVQDLRARCVMTYDPDTQKQNPKILKEIVPQGFSLGKRLRSNSSAEMPSRPR